MSEPLPSPDLSKISRLDAEPIVLAKLATMTKGESLAQLQGKLGAVLTTAAVESAVGSLRAMGCVDFAKGRLVCTLAGRSWLTELYGFSKAFDNDGAMLRLALRVLGMDLGGADAKRIIGARAKGEALAAAIVTRVYGLPEKGLSYPKVARSALVWAVLVRRIPELVGPGPHPEVEKGTAVARAILNGMAKGQSATVGAAFVGLAASAVGASGTKWQDLAAALVRLGGNRATRDERSRNPEPVSDIEFVKRVRGVASKLETPPFRGQVAIAQVHAAYGAQFADGGPLSRFKERLVAAARAEQLDLARLEVPGALSADLQEQSRTRWGSEFVHFVVAS